MLLVAPEWRLSLHLKGLELEPKRGQPEADAALDALAQLAALPYVDILDESDELLHHRWGLQKQCCCEAVAITGRIP